VRAQAGNSPELGGVQVAGKGVSGSCSEPGVDTDYCDQVFLYWVCKSRPGERLYINISVVLECEMDSWI
jgi:hypothetical protein